MVSLAQLSHADIIGAKAGIDYWFYDGQLNRNQQNFNDQDLDQKGSPQLSLSIEHPVPLIPNAGVKGASASDSPVSSSVANLIVAPIPPSPASTRSSSSAAATSVSDCAIALPRIGKNADAE